MPRLCGALGSSVWPVASLAPSAYAAAVTFAPPDLRPHPLLHRAAWLGVGLLLLACSGSGSSEGSGPPGRRVVCDVAVIQARLEPLLHETFPDNTDERWTLEQLHAEADLTWAQAVPETARVGYPRVLVAFMCEAADDPQVWLYYAPETAAWRLLGSDPAATAAERVPQRTCDRDPCPPPP